MHRLLMILAAAALAHAAQAQPTAPKPAPKPAAMPQHAGFDARDPASLIALLSGLGATANLAERTDTEVKLGVTTPTYSFGVQFVDCSADGRGCQGLAFTTSSDSGRANLAQMNGFNQTSITCRAFMDNAGRPHVVYSTLLSAADTREEMRTHLGVWQGCLSTFGAFLADPNGYLAAAP